MPWPASAGAGCREQPVIVQSIVSGAPTAPPCVVAGAARPPAPSIPRVSAQVQAAVCWLEELTVEPRPEFEPLNPCPAGHR